MANILISGGGGGGVSSDEVTVTAGDVLKGKTYLGSDTDDEIGTGTLELTGDAGLNDVLSGKTFYTSDPKVKQTGTLALSGNAAPQYVYSGKTFYSTDPKNKQTGTMTVSSVVSFSTAVSGATVTLKWQNPAKGPYGGVIIRVKEGSYPTSVSDGSQAYRGTGTNSAVNGQSTATWTAPNNNRTYYFRLWVYCDTSQGTLYSGNKDATAWIAKIQGSKTFTSSGTFTVPTAVTQIQIFCVGGGGGGGGGGDSQYDTPYKQQSMNAGGGGGGGGYTTTQTISVSPGQSIPVTIGAGGARAYMTVISDFDHTTSWGHQYNGNTGGTGGTTTCGSYSASGGKGGTGGNPGRCTSSEAGIGASSTAAGGAGTGNGGDGKLETRQAGNGGAGTSYNGTTYCGGGAGATGYGKNHGSPGGRGGTMGLAASANTGGGGGGGTPGNVSGYPGVTKYYSGAGGSGVCIIRWGY